MSRRNALLSRAGSGVGLAVIACILILVLIRVFFPQAILTAETPFLRLSSAISTYTSTVFSGFDNAATLAAERDTLLNDNATLSQENAVLTARIADLEGVGTNSSIESGIVASVLARPPLTGYDTLVVASGSSVGVGAGDIAYASSSIPVGVVTGVTSSSARITLLSASGEATPAWVGAARTPITLLGVGAGAFRATAPRAASTTVGDLVYVGGPGSVPVGVVRAQGGEASAPFITLSISGIVNIFSLPVVRIRHEGSVLWPLGAPIATTTSAL